MSPKTPTRTLSLLISIILVAAPATAQRGRAPAPPPKETTKAESNAAALTFDTLLAADSYKLYGEIKNVGQVIHSGGVADIIDPIMKLAGPPKEFKSLIKFANAHAEILTTSRMMFAAWPARAKLPQVLVAIEFSSPDEARKFEPQLREFLPTLIPPPTPTPTPAATATPAPEPNSSAQTSPAPETEKTDTEKKTATAAVKEAEPPAPPPFVIKQSGNLVLISDTAFTLKSLRPKDSSALAEDPNFRQVRDRFATEPLFLFFNLALEYKSSPTIAKKEREQPEVVEDPNQKPGDEPGDQAAPEMMPAPEIPATSPEAAPARVVIQPGTPTVVVPQPGQPAGVLVAQDPSTQGPQPTFEPIFSFLMGSLLFGQPKYPEAVGAAIAFDADGYVVRVLLVNGPGAKATLLPFIPQLISGPSVALESPSLLPADTELFIAASLDAPQTYDGLLVAMNEANAREQGLFRRSKAAAPESPFAAYEKKLGIKIKEDLLPVLGNEIAVGIQVASLFGTPASQPTPAEPTSGQLSSQVAAKKRALSPVILISLKDKEAARALVPRVIDSLGFKGASKLAQTERRDDTEVVSYANALSYAFIGNFLVLSLDTATTRHVVDSYLNHQTLASDSHFRSYTRWQPRQVLGQVYISPALMDSYRSVANEPTALVSDKLRELLLGLSSVPEPVSYALSNEGVGPLHELHLPKNLVLMMVAGISSAANQSPMMRNESMARAALSMIASAQARYRADQGKGSYATLDQLIAQGMVQKEMLENYGYKIELTVSGDKFAATAVPAEYNKTGRLSYFVDESMVVRGGDHAGGPATVADSPVQ